ncbi:hypothetical protein [Rhizobium sp. NFR03]|uniref:hypothetical protein n=1 Tax=Rhizobium sp. NFR03 TaxID=1566263 RepID=UPI0008D11427|nr:hypothetical protein [Rhizobium sp. NFR03]SER90653.1 hypothetical protein SAMN03159406_01500 [Rhizobium sp. NFR03]
MSGLETAIKQALERSDRASAETRARIYQSARNALEAGLRKQNVQDEAVVSQQRHRLEVTIHAIEQQERAALRDLSVVHSPVSSSQSSPPPVSPQEPVSAAEPRVAVTDTPRAEQRAGGRNGERQEPGFAEVKPEHPSSRNNAPSFDAPDLDEPRGDAREEHHALHPDRDDAAFAGAPTPMVAPVRDAQRPGAQARDAVNDLGLPGAEPLVPRRRRGRGGRIASILMVTAVLVAAVGSATWWVMSTGLLERPQGQPAPPPTVAAEDFDGGAGLRTLGAQAGFTADWIDLYLPTATSGVTPGARARTEVVRDESGVRLRIASGAGDNSGNVAIDVPASALQRMSGQTSTIALSVQSANGKPTQFSVECDFASLGDCGRHRFTVNDEKSDMLFKVTFDRTLSPNGPGRILVNSDVTANGGGLDLYAIRLLPGQ